MGAAIGRVTQTQVPVGLWLLNLVHQRLLGINGEIPFMVHFTSRVLGRIRIGENVWKSFALSGCCYFQGFNGIEIGDNTIFAPHVSVISANHSLEGGLSHLPSGPVTIGKDCWIGTHAVILPGVSLGNRVTVGAGAVVTRSFPDGAVIAGVPAKIIRASGSD